jgi:2,3-bisphosphoglycerate-dependent phosphoglycerate mutase
MVYLVLVRHGLSDYNKKGLWTGWDNPALCDEGFEQSRKTGEQLKDIRFDYAYSSDQIRSVQTIEEILKAAGQNIPITQNGAIRERNYGIYTRKNKWEVQKEIGDEEFHKLRRGWDYPIPSGESLKQVYEREVPYFQQEIEPKLHEGKNVIIASSGNALRALVKYLENISDEQISGVEIGTGEAYVYKLDSKGNILSKEIRGQNPNKLKV